VNRFPLLQMLLILVCVALAAPAAQAADTPLADSEGLVRATLPGKWREAKTSIGIAAAGFLGVKRAEFFAIPDVVNDDVAGAAESWKKSRTARGGEPTYAGVEGEGLRFTAHSAARGTVEYVSVVTGNGATAVAWIRVAGAPGVVAEEAWAALARVETGKKAAPLRSGEGGEEEPAASDELEVKDPALRIAVTFPAGFKKRKDAPPAGARVIAVTGKVGSDEHAYVDVYLLDSFKRTDAAGHWWREAERRGWFPPIQIAGSLLSFTLEVQGETWTRHVRIIDTPAGVVALKVDAESQTKKSAAAFIEMMVAKVEVLQKLDDPPHPPIDFKVVEGKGVTVHAESESIADALRREAEEVDAQVQALTGLEPRGGRNAVVVVYASREKLVSAQKLAGLDVNAAGEFDPRAGVVRTFAKPFAETVDRQRLREELARDAMHRRLGYRAPWWLERGAALLIGSGAHHRGRINRPHPDLLEGARDAAGGTVEFEATRWWLESESIGNPERDAVLWSYMFLLSLDAPPGKKWREPFQSYCRELQSSPRARCSTSRRSRTSSTSGRPGSGSCRGSARARRAACLTCGPPARPVCHPVVASP